MLNALVIVLQLAKPPAPVAKRVDYGTYELRNPLKTAVVVKIECGHEFLPIETTLAPKSVEILKVSSPDPDLMPWCSITSWKEIQ